MHIVSLLVRRLGIILRIRNLFLWFSVSMYTSSQISAPSLAPNDTSNWFFFSPNVSFVVVWDCSSSMYYSFELRYGYVVNCLAQLSVLINRLSVIDG